MKAPSAAFSLQDFSIEQFTYKAPKPGTEGVHVIFIPSGVYNSNTGDFILSFEFKAGQDENITEDFQTVSVVSHTIFNFRDKPSFSDLPVYFYRNAIAIVFPYIRAFVASLTAAAGVQPLQLPIMNLTGLEQTFKDATVELNEQKETTEIPNG